jgi:hypothetical protein
MPSLQVRDVPDGLYYRLQENARKQHRSLSQQAIIELERSLDIKHDARERRGTIIKTIVSSPLVQDTDHLPDPVSLVREDRENR